MEKVWYYMKRDRQKYGPYTDNEIISLIHQTILTADDYIWMPDLENWLKIGNSIYSVYIPAEEETEDEGQFE